MDSFTLVTNPLKVPRDPSDESFVKSFDIATEADEIISFFNEFGFVVIRDVLTEAELKETVKECWDLVRSESRGKVNPEDPSTWLNRNWPGIREEGIIGSACLFAPNLVRNRQNPKLYSTFKTLLGTGRLLINQDRIGLFRPIVDFPVAGESHKEWKTRENLHFDMNPWAYVWETNDNVGQEILASLTYERDDDFITENNEVGIMRKDPKKHIQGLINLLDNREDDGGFHLVPGFHNYLEEFVKATWNLSKSFLAQDRFIVLPRSNPIYNSALRITARAGSMVLWDQRVLHGSAPNQSPNFRMAQFLKVFSADDVEPERFRARREGVKERLGEMEQDLTELGRKMFGLDKWGSRD